MTHFWVAAHQLRNAVLEYLSTRLCHPPSVLLPLFFLSLSSTVPAPSPSAPFIYSSQLSLHCKPPQSSAALTPSEEPRLGGPIAENAVQASGSLVFDADGGVSSCRTQRHVAVALLFAQQRNRHELRRWLNIQAQWRSGPPAAR